MLITNCHRNRAESSTHGTANERIDRYAAHEIDVERASEACRGLKSPVWAPTLPVAAMHVT
jgi:hypothetical protein